MTKLEFLSCLSERLSSLPADERNDRLRFYSEMIDDRVEEGLSEQDAVSSVGSVDDIISQIVLDSPQMYPRPDCPKPSRSLSGWTILLLVLGSPVWIPLMISGLAVLFSLYFFLWTLILSLWTAFVSVVIFALFGVLAGFISVFGINCTAGLALIGAGAFCGGLGVFLFFLCKAATKGAAFLTVRGIAAIVKCFNRRG